MEIDEFYFGPRRQRGKYGRGAAKKIVVLGLRKRNGKTYAEVIPDASQTEIIPIIRATDLKTEQISIPIAGRTYDALAVYGYNHKKVNHQKNEFVKEDIHINGVESFWSWTKRRLVKFKGVPKPLFEANLLDDGYLVNETVSLFRKRKKLLSVCTGVL